MQTIEHEYERLIAALDDRGYLNYERGTVGNGQLGNWLFAATGGDGEGYRADHAIKGATHGNYLCGIYLDGVMLWIDQHRHVYVHCAESPDLQIAKLGCQDSRCNGNMWPTLERGKWISYHNMPDSAKPTIKAIIRRCLEEAREAQAEVDRRKAARDKTNQAAAQARQNNIAADWAAAVAKE